MTDTECLNLIEHYKWIINPVTESGYNSITKVSYCKTIFRIYGKFGEAEGNGLRQAVNAALDKQVKWALGVE